MTDTLANATKYEGSPFAPLIERIGEHLTEGDIVVQVGGALKLGPLDMAIAVLESGAIVAQYVVDNFGSNPQIYLLDGDRAAPTRAHHIASFMQRIKPIAERGHSIKLFAADEVEAAENFEINSIDFLMIDDIRNDERLTDVVKAWWPKLAVGGWLGVNDAGFVRPALEALFPDLGVVQAPRGWPYFTLRKVAA